MRILLLILDGLLAYWALRVIDTAPRFTAKWRNEQGRAVLAYIVFLACAIFAMVLLPLEQLTDRGVLYATGAMLCWVAIGVLWLLRKAPGDVRRPQWLLTPWGIADGVLIALVVACSAAAAVG